MFCAGSQRRIGLAAIRGACALFVVACTGVAAVACGGSNDRAQSPLGGGRVSSDAEIAQITCELQDNLLQAEDLSEPIYDFESKPTTVEGDTGVSGVEVNLYGSFWRYSQSAYLFPSPEVAATFMAEHDGGVVNAPDLGDERVVDTTSTSLNIGCRTYSGYAYIREGPVVAFLDAKPCGSDCGRCVSSDEAYAKIVALARIVDAKMQRCSGRVQPQ
jgi:hypothetical protein